MTTQAPESTWEESVDLGKFIATIFSHWWLILTLVAAFAASAAVFSFLIQPTVYQSEGGIVIPASDIENEFRLPPQGYLKFSGSTQVFDALRRQLGPEQTAGQLRNQLKFSLEDDQFLAVSAKAETADGAFLLANAWSQAYLQANTARMENRFRQSLDQAIKKVNILHLQFNAAEAELAKSNQLDNPGHKQSRLANLGSLVTYWEELLQNLASTRSNLGKSPLVSLETQLEQGSSAVGGGGIPGTNSTSARSLNALIPDSEELFRADPAYVEMMTRLSRSRLSVLEQDLVSSENKLRELRIVSLPTTESKVASLEEILESESEFLGLALKDGSPIPNPVYLQLRQDLADARLLLSTQRIEEQALSEKIATLEAEIDPVIESAQIEELDLEIAEVTQELIAQLAEVNSLAQKLVAAEPTLPDRQLSLQGGRNIILGVFLGLVAGIVASLLLDNYRGRTRVPAL